jgi:hypothetical protein
VPCAPQEAACHNPQLCHAIVFSLVARGCL